MLWYIIRRTLYAIPILFGVNILIFLLFFTVNSPDDMARMHLGEKYVTQSAVDNWKAGHSYDKPLFLDSSRFGFDTIKHTVLYDKSVKMIGFDFGRSDNNRDISYDISERMWPSLMLAVPTLIIGIMVNITFALLLAFFRRSYLDVWGASLCIGLMSISGLFYIIAGQYMFGKILKIVPISGYQDGWLALKFVFLPVIIGVIGGIGSGTRWYRTIFLEEMTKDYVRTARAKGLSEVKVLYKHVLKNGMIPILTGIVVVIPSLFMGSLVMESFFSIPGLGSYTIEAIQSQDFAIVHAMVFLGSILYIIGLVLTDISYVLVDPRVKFK